MGRRLDLQRTLVELLGSPNVYFQPPPTIKMEYPCIVYMRDAMQMRHASDQVYMKRTRYQVTVIDRDPDSPIPDAVASLPLCTFERFYAVDHLNHDVFNLFY